MNSKILTTLKDFRKDIESINWNQFSWQVQSEFATQDVRMRFLSVGHLLISLLFFFLIFSFSLLFLDRQPTPDLSRFTKNICYIWFLRTFLECHIVVITSLPISIRMGTFWIIKGHNVQSLYIFCLFCSCLAASWDARALGFLGSVGATFWEIQYPKDLNSVCLKLHWEGWRK